MATPYLIESTATNLGQPLSRFQGPFKRGSNWYAAIEDFTIVPFGQKFAGVSKSTDDGVTWTMQDQANESRFGSNCDVAEDNAHGPLISFVFNNISPNELRLKTFNTATDTWSAPVTGGPSGSIFGAGVLYPLQHAMLSNGDRVVVWEAPTGGGNDALKVVLYNGTWQTPITIQASTGGNTVSLLTVLADSSDRVHIWRRDDRTNQIKYCQFVAGALGADTIIAGIGPFVVFNYGLYLTAQDEVVVPLQGTISGTFLNVLRGTPSSAPVFTIEPAANPALTCRSTQIAVRPDESVLYLVVYLVDPNPFNHATIQWYSQPQPPGAWDASPTLLWDEVTDPPTPPQTIYDDDAPISVIVADSPLAMALTTGYFGNDILGDGFCAIQIFLQGPLGTAISILCPVAPLTATVGVFYQSDPPVVVGDTPPDTFVLSDAPPWMSIDPLTGVVSGTPTFEGDVEYTITVTDSLGNTATVSAPCPLAVSNPIPPPPFCIVPPATGQEVLVLVNEPLENQGT